MISNQLTKKSKIYITEKMSINYVILQKILQVLDYYDILIFASKTPTFYWLFIKIPRPFLSIFPKVSKSECQKDFIYPLVIQNSDQFSYRRQQTLKSLNYLHIDEFHQINIPSNLYSIKYQNIVRNITKKSNNNFHYSNYQGMKFASRWQEKGYPFTDGFRMMTDELKLGISKCENKESSTDQVQSQLSVEK